MSAPVDDAAAAQEVRRCGVPWPVCPYCLGRGLEESAGRASCPVCRREWAISAVEPCPWPAVELLCGVDGGGLVCASHAQHPSARLLRPAAGVLSFEAERARRTGRTRPRVYSAVER